MKILYPTSQTRPFYDRYPVVAHQQYEATAVAPHALTQRISYTIPTGKRAVLEYVFISAVRLTAAAPVGIVQLIIGFQPVATFFTLVDNYFSDNTIGVTHFITVPCQIFLEAGGTLLASTADLSTGGTMRYTIDAFIHTFDP